jgi:hypothetical protein
MYNNSDTIKKTLTKIAIGVCVVVVVLVALVFLT